MEDEKPVSDTSASASVQPSGTQSSGTTGLTVNECHDAAVRQPSPVPRERRPRAPVVSRRQSSSAGSVVSAVVPRRRSTIGKPSERSPRDAGPTPASRASRIPVPAAPEKTRESVKSVECNDGKHDPLQTTSTPGNASDIHHDQTSESPDTPGVAEGVTSSSPGVVVRARSQVSSSPARTVSEITSNARTPGSPVRSSVPAARADASSSSACDRSHTLSTSRRTSKPPPPPKDKARLSVLVENSKSRTPTGSPFNVRRPAPAHSSDKQGTPIGKCNGDSTQTPEQKPQNRDTADQVPSKSPPGQSKPLSRQRTGSGSVPKRKAPVVVPKAKPTPAAASGVNRNSFSKTVEMQPRRQSLKLDDKLKKSDALSDNESKPEVQSAVTPEGVASQQSTGHSETITTSRSIASHSSSPNQDKSRASPPSKEFARPRASGATPLKPPPKVRTKPKPAVAAKSSPIQGSPSPNLRPSSLAQSQNRLSTPGKPSKPASPVMQRRSAQFECAGTPEESRSGWRLSLSRVSPDGHFDTAPRTVSPALARKVALMGLDAESPTSEQPHGPGIVSPSPLASPVTETASKPDVKEESMASTGGRATPPLPAKKRSRTSAIVTPAQSHSPKPTRTPPAAPVPSLKTASSASPRPPRSPKPAKKVQTATASPDLQSDETESSPSPQSNFTTGSATTDDLQDRRAPRSPARVQRSKTIMVRSESPSPSPGGMSPLASPRNASSPVPRKRTRTSVTSPSPELDAALGITEAISSGEDMSGPSTQPSAAVLSKSLPTGSILLQFQSPTEDVPDKEAATTADGVHSADDTQAEPEQRTQADATSSRRKSPEDTVHDIEVSSSRSRSPTRRSMKRRAPTPPANVRPFTVEEGQPAPAGSGSPKTWNLSRSLSTPPASPLTRRSSNTVDDRMLPSSISDNHVMSFSAPAGENTSFLGSNEDILGTSSRSSSRMELELHPTDSESGKEDVSTVRRSRRGAPPPPRGLKSPPPIAESPDEPSPLDSPVAGPMYAMIPEIGGGQAQGNSQGKKSATSLGPPQQPAPAVPAPAVPEPGALAATRKRSGSIKRKAPSPVNPYASADSQQMSVSMPSSPLLQKSPSPDVTMPTSPQPKPRARPQRTAPAISKAASESDLVSESPPLPKRNPVTRQNTDTSLPIAPPASEGAYGVRTITDMESPMYACIPELGGGAAAAAAAAAAAGKDDQLAQDKREEDGSNGEPRSESVSPETASCKSPHLTEEEERQLQEQIKTLDEELEVEKKTQRSLQQMFKLLDGDKAIDVAEKMDKNEAAIAELEKELAKLREIESGERKIDNEQRIRLRKQVINELVTTEKTFINDMKLCVEGFLNPLREEGAVDVKQLFGNLEELVEVAQNFLELLESRISVESGEEAQLANCFTDMRDELSQVYAQYCRNHDDASDLMMKLDSTTEHQERMSQLSEDVRTLHNAKAWDLQSFLIKPVQRVLKYPLLLRELSKYTDFSHPDKKELKQAMEIMEGVAREINEFKRRKDLMLKYKKSTEEAAKVGMGKLSWHSVTKKTSRFTQKIGQATGFTASTIDKKFHDEETLFRELEKATKQLLKNVQEHVQFTQELNAVMQKVLLSSQSFYGDSTDNNFGMYLQACNFQIGGSFGSFMDDLKTGVVDRLERLISQFETPRFFIDKRNDKLLDYDSCKNRVDKYKADPERLKEFKEELKRKQREYEAMNAQLLEDLPKLVTVSLKIMLGIVASWENLQQIYCANCAQILTELSTLDMIPSGAENDDDVTYTHTQTLLCLYDKWKGFKIVPKGWVERSLASPTNRGSLRVSRMPSTMSGSLDALNLTAGRRTSAESLASSSVSNLSIDSNFSFDLKSTARKRPPIPMYMQQESSISQASVVSDFEAGNDTELTVTRGSFVEVLAKTDTSNNADWWKVKQGQKSGYVPAAYLSDSGISDVGSFSRMSSNSSMTSSPGKPRHAPPLAPKKSREEPEYAEAAAARPSQTRKTSGVSDVNPYRAVDVLITSGTDSESASSSVASTPSVSPEPVAFNAGAQRAEDSRSSKVSVSSMHAHLPVHRVAYDFEAESATEITLKEGELVKVLTDHDTTGNNDWWLVMPTDCEDPTRRGYIPAAYLEDLVA
eukprot:scpid23988/ scgid21653/ Dynamin-binding protein; Scaffold protein Tuba